MGDCLMRGTAAVVVAMCAAFAGVAAIGAEDAPKPVGTSPSVQHPANDDDATPPRPVGASPAEKKPQMPSPEDMKKMMEAQMAMLGPGPEHAVLKPLVGTWTLATKVFADPSVPPMESAGTAEGTSEYDGRFVTVRTDGVVMGMPWKGSYMLGYNRFKKHYSLVIWSNMGTEVNMGTGSYDEKTRAITYKVVMDDGQGKRDTRVVIRLEGEDRSVLEAYDTLPTGMEVKVLETVFTRVK